MKSLVEAIKEHTPEKTYLRMTLREYAAVAAMQGYMSGCSPEITGDYDMDNEPEVCKQHFDAVAVWCIGYADALIAKLEEGRG